MTSTAAEQLLVAEQLIEHLKCPISLEIMSDPVTLSSGETFDRSSIQQWLDLGHRKCPITKLPLLHTYLIPNHALRAIISSFAPPPPETLPCPPPLQTEAQTLTLTQTLVSSLTSNEAPTNYKLNSLSKLIFLSKHDPLFRRNITDAPVIPVVFSCLADETLRHKSLTLLLNISLEDENKVGLMAEGILDRLITIISSEASDCRAVAATLITSLSLLELNRATIGAYPHAIESLVSLIRDGVGREKKEAATALYTVCRFPNNRITAVACGAIPVLLRRLDAGLERCVEVIGLLAERKEAIEEMEKFGGCVEVLAGVLKNRTRTKRGVEFALLALKYLCCNSEESVKEAVRAGVFESCMGLMQHDSVRVRENASYLILVLCSRKQ